MKIYEEPNERETITYRHREPRAVVVSGTRRYDLLRPAHPVLPRPIWNSVHLEYPAAEKAAYDALASHVARSLRAGPSWQVRACK